MSINPKGPESLFWLPLAPCTHIVHIHMCMQKSHTYKIHLFKIIYSLLYLCICACAHAHIQVRRQLWSRFSLLTMWVTGKLGIQAWSQHVCVHACVPAEPISGFRCPLGLQLRVVGSCQGRILRTKFRFSASRCDFKNISFLLFPQCRT